MMQNISQKPDHKWEVENQLAESNKLSVLVPIFNSEKTIEALIDTVITVLQPHFTDGLELVLVNDGSVDNSHSRILGAIERYPGFIKYIRLARNFGEHNAVMCGLNYITGDYVAVIDDDFQNPPTEILNLVAKLCEGYDVVYSVYAEKHHSWFRNLGSWFNDWAATKLLKKPKGLYLSSFKVIRASLVHIIIQYQGPYPYIDGIILRSTTRIGRQLCKHQPRQVGRSNYTIGKLVHLWLNMFTGYSIIPLRVASLIGLLISFSTIILIIFFAISRLTGGILFTQNIPAGWASLIIAVTFFAGLQLCVLGLIGEYLGRMFLMFSGLPQFVIRATYGIENIPEVIDAR